VKRQTNGQNDVKNPVGISKAQQMTQRDEVVGKKVQIFENNEHQTGRNNAGNEQNFPLIPFYFFEIDSCRIVNYNSYQKNEYILGNKKHVEETTCRKQVHPSVFMRQQIKQQSNNGEESQKGNRVKKHIYKPLFQK
jgi:hypothetical protein